MLGYAELAASTMLYGMGIIAQSVAARRAESRTRTGLGLLVRLVRDRMYLLGFAGQAGGFILAFFARASLPLYLVQAGTSCAIGLATVFGVLVLEWRVRTVEVAMLVVMAFGLVLLATASTPSVANNLPPAMVLALLGLVLLLALATTYASRFNTVVSLAVVAGAAFAVVAISGRSLADEPLLELSLHPLVWLMLVAALLGQAGLAVALTRGSATSTVASMDATTMVLTSVVGIVALGDQVRSGQHWSVVLGLVLVLVSVLVLGAVSGLVPDVTSSASREAS